MRMLIALFAAAALTATTFAGPSDVKMLLNDPMHSGMWSFHQKAILGDPDSIRFDSRVVVRAPAYAEDSLAVPVLVDASAIPDVERIVLFADYGPIPEILTFYPGRAKPKLGFRFKIDQTTPIRAAVRTHSGTWHVGATAIDAAGGGCTAPAAAYATADWEEDLMKVTGAVWPESGRVKVTVDHPMDTGLADGIPVFIIKHVDVADEAGDALARIELHEPVSEDPTFTMFLREGERHESVRVSGRDNNGGRFDATLRPLLLQ